MSIKCLSLAAMLALFSASMMAQLPDLIDREAFFGDPEIVGGQLSPDGEFVSFLKPYLGTRNIWVKKIDEPFENARPLTADTLRPIGGYFWSHDGRYILYVQDKGGDENYHVYAVNPNDPIDAKLGVPLARNITDIDGVRAAIYAVPESMPGKLYVGLNDRDASYHDLYLVDIQSGERELIHENTNKISSWTFDHNDELRMAVRSTDEGGTEILNYADGEFTKVYECSAEESCYPYEFDAQNKRVYLLTNKAPLNLSTAMLMDPTSGETTLYEADPLGEVDFGGLFTSDQTHEVIATIYVGAKPRLYFKDKKWEEEYEMLKERFDDAQINFVSNTKDENKFLISVSSDIDPGSVYLYDRSSKQTEFLYRPRKDIPVEALAPMTPVSYPSSDGLSIPAYLTLPKGVEAKNLPAVLLVHGGPWARDFWGYNSYAQFLANRGYAVLSMNFRGSTGYGKEFLNAGNGEWGRLMQDDVTYGAQYLIEKGIADPKKIAIMGGSYGGYATLAGVTFTPDTYAAAVDIVGPSNLITLLESIPAYWASFRKQMYVRMADPETEEGKQWLYERSPLNYVQNIRTPLLIIQGANDPRVKQAEADQIVVAMRDHDLPVEYLLAEDEGHGFHKPVNQMAMIAATERFLANHIGGRYQESMTDEVANRLEEIKVDIRTVTLPEGLSDDFLNQPLPLPTGDVATGQFQYAISLEIGGQSMSMSQNNNVSQTNEHIAIDYEMTTPMGNISGVIQLHNNSLKPKFSSMNQGPVSAEMTYNTDMIHGKISAQGNEEPIEIKLDNDIAPDGEGLSLYLASLRLEPGMTALIRSVDGNAMKVKTYKMSVSDMEDVHVNSGDFKVYKVSLVPADGSPGSQDFWIDSDRHLVVKKEAILPEMGGAVMKSELTSYKIDN